MYTSYPTDVIKSQWKITEPLPPERKKAWQKIKMDFLGHPQSYFLHCERWTVVSVENRFQQKLCFLEWMEEACNVYR